MKVESIEIKNFKGIEHFTHEFRKPITAITGPVGAGKTSFLQAFRYGLTNETPVDPIRNDASCAIVKLNCEDDMTIEREVARPAKKASRIMGRKTGTAASESVIEDTTSVTNDVMKIVTSSQVLEALKPSQFGALFLNDSAEEKTLDDLIEIMIESTIKEKKAVMSGFEKEEEEKKLPPDVMTELKARFKGKKFNLDAINKVFEESKKIRRDTNDLYKTSASKSKGFLEIVKPEYTKKDLDKKYEEIIGVEKNVAAYKTSVEIYKKALESKKIQDKRISELEIEIAMNRATEPDATEYANLIKRKNQINEDILTNSKLLQTLIDNKKWFKNTLDELEKPVCPISKKLLCKTDKSSIKNELIEKMDDIDLSVSVLNGKIEDAKKRLKDVEESIVTYNKNKENYNKKVLLEKEKDKLIKNPVYVPEEPEKMKLKSDYSVEKAEIKEKLELLSLYENAEMEYKNTRLLKRRCVVNEFIVKSLDPKGPVIQRFIETFLGLIEDAANDRAEILKPGFKVKLIAENGLTVLFRTDSGKKYLPYTSLSAGEKIFAILILTDLINSYYDSRVLILDDTDHLDSNTFRQLMDFLTNIESLDLYDNVIVSCVEHNDTKKIIKEYDVDLIEM